MKVLFFTLTFSSGGSEAFIVNLIEKIDKEKYEVELMCINDIPGIYDERLKKLGVEIQTLDNEGIFNPFVRYVKSYKAFNRFINKNKGKYEVIHFCLSQGEDLPFIHIAKRAGVPIRILHSHNSSVNSTLKYIGHVLCKALYKNDATSYLACSEIAAEWLIPKKDFRGKNYKIIKNGIDVEKYQYKVSERKISLFL